MGKLFLVSILCLGFAFSSCKKAADDATTTTTTGGGTGGGTTTPKAMLSLWTIANSAWHLDLSAGNLTGTPFTFSLYSADNVHGCAINVTLTGTTSSGTCVWNSGANIAGGTGGGAGFTCADNGSGYGICSGGAYTNNGTNMTISTGTAYH